MCDADEFSPTPSILSGHVWQYLNAALVKSAGEVFRNLPLRNGLEAWRRIYRWIHSGSPIQRRTLKKRVDQPGAARDIAHVPMAIEQWETNMRLLRSAGGKDIDDEEKRMTLAEILPRGMRDHLIWKYDDFANYEEFKQHVLGKAEELDYLDRERRHPGAHAVEFEQVEDALQDEHGDGEIIDKATFQDEINAIMDRFGVTRGEGGKFVRRTPGPPRPHAASRPAPKRAAIAKGGKQRCINCGGHHPTAECRKARVPREEQPCWTCGKKGHPSAKCPERQSRPTPTKAVGDADDEDDWMAMLAPMEDCDNEGYTTVRPRRNGKPSPGAFTIADYMRTPPVKRTDENRFGALTTEDENRSGAPTTDSDNSY